MQYEHKKLIKFSAEESVGPRIILDDRALKQLINFDYETLLLI
jgi:hypothetical protein